MNKTRRRALREIADKLDELKEALDGHRSDEQDYIDNIPESLQGSDRASAAEEAVSNLEDAYSSLDDALSSIEAAIGD